MLNFWLFRRNPKKYYFARFSLLTIIDAILIIGGIIWFNRSNLEENALNIAILAGLLIITSMFISLFLFLDHKNSKQKSE